MYYLQQVIDAGVIVHNLGNVVDELDYCFRCIVRSSSFATKDHYFFHLNRISEITTTSNVATINRESTHHALFFCFCEALNPLISGNHP